MPRTGDDHIFESHRNRPDDLAGEPRSAGLSALIEAADGDATSDGLGAFGDVLSPHAVGAAVLDAVRADRFYVLTHPEITRTLVRTRCDDIVECRSPSALRS